VQLPEPPNDPVVGVDVNATVPAGVLTPLVAVSVTVAVHVVELPVTTDAGVQATLVEVGEMDVIAGDLPLLAPCAPSPGYPPVIVYELATEGVNVTWHDAVSGVPVAASVQLPELPNDPVVGADVNATVPVGVLAPLLAVSPTVAVHVVGLPVMTDAGAQATVVDVGSSPVPAPFQLVKMSCPNGVTPTASPIRPSPNRSSTVPSIE
jgi:hypothetical protein